VDLQVFGRKTYQLMVPYWPDVAKNQSETKASHEFAKTFVSKNKIVFSQSLESAEDKNTKIVRMNLRDEIGRYVCCDEKFVLVVCVFQAALRPTAWTRLSRAWTTRW
jgi:hypothetical protein